MKATCKTGVRILIIVLMCLSMNLTACNAKTAIEPDDPETEIEDKDVIPELPDYIKLEAENATLSGSLKKETGYSGYSGSGYVGEFSSEGDMVTFSLPKMKPGRYVLVVSYYCMYSEKKNNVLIDGDKAEFSFPKNDTFGEIALCKFNINDDDRKKISISKSWGYFAVDYIVVRPADSLEFDIDGSLANTNASEEAKNLYSYLLDNFGKKIITGQTGDNEAEYIKTLTGKSPLIRAYDYMDYSPSRLEYGASSSDTEKAMEWHRKGGIVTIAWHWNAPKDLIDTEEHRWWSGFYTNATTFDVEYAMNNPDSEDYALVIRDLDTIAAQLKRLQDAKVPVLWRPLHEASGKWFWWGAKGAEPCVRLYRLMYERFTDFHKLNNLIWVWTSYADPDALAWYPGDSYVDIIGADIYDKGNFGSQYLNFESLKELFKGRKMIVISENGSIPDPDAMVKDEAMWGYFVTWSGSFITDSSYNPSDHIKKVYDNPHIITYENRTNQ